MNRRSRTLDFVSMRLRNRGIELLDGEHVVDAVAFDAVRQIVAFKQDLFTTDLICVAFIVEAENGLIVHEEMPGFKDLFDTLLASFPGLDREWYTRVMHPAFATNKIVVWERAW